MAPLTVLQADTITWRGHKWVTVLDSFSKEEMAHHVVEMSSQAALTALQTWFQFYGVPERIISDNGREFDNGQVKEAMNELRITWNFNTPSHTKGRGGVERLHSTLSEHLRIYQESGGLEPDVAMRKAISAYNHSIHIATGFSPFEALFGLFDRRRDWTGSAVTEEVGNVIRTNRGQLQRRWGRIKDRIELEKSKSVARENLGIRDAGANVKIGIIVYRRISANQGSHALRRPLQGYYSQGTQFCYYREHRGPEKAQNGPFRAIEAPSN